MIDNYWFSRIAPIDGKQRELTSKLIVPHMQDINDVIWHMRNEIDSSMVKSSIRSKKQVRQKPRTVQPPYVTRLANARGYPVGACCVIRNQLVNKIWFSEEGYKLKKLIKKFREKGGIFKKFYCIQKGEYFQNAIQVGSLCIDGANDTLNPKHDKVVIGEIEDMQMSNINSYEQYASVREKYTGTTVYPNVYIPLLSPFFPMIEICKYSGIIKMFAKPGLASKNVLSGFSLSRDFILNSKYSDRRLPRKLETIMLNAIEKITNKMSKDNKDIFPSAKAVENLLGYYMIDENGIGEDWFDYIYEIFGIDNSQSKCHGLVYISQQIATRFNSQNIRLRNKDLQELKESGELPNLIIKDHHDYALAAMYNA